MAFTLVDVLIALMIIAIALTAALRASTESTRATTHVQDVMVAHWVGLTVLSEIQTHIISLDDSHQGKTQMLGREFSWSAQTSASQQFDHVQRVKITVSVRGRVVGEVVGYSEVGVGV